MVHWTLALALQCLLKEGSTGSLLGGGAGGGAAGRGGPSAEPRLRAVRESKSQHLEFQRLPVGPAFTKSTRLAFRRMEPVENLLEVEENPCSPLRNQEGQKLSN